MHHTTPTLIRWQTRLAMRGVRLWIHCMLMVGVPKHRAMAALDDIWDEIEDEMYR